MFISQILVSVPNSKNEKKKPKIQILKKFHKFLNSKKFNNSKNSKKIHRRKNSKSSKNSKKKQMPKIPQNSKNLNFQSLNSKLYTLRILKYYISLF